MSPLSAVCLLEGSSLAYLFIFVRRCCSYQETVCSRGVWVIKELCGGWVIKNFLQNVLEDWFL